MAKGKIRVRASLSGDVTEVKALMRHPMETGLRKDAEGNAIPAHFIEEVIAKCNDKVVLTGHWGASISANPFLAFQFKGGKPGDTVSVEWTDNQGQKDFGEAVIK
jgi:sulfur-oxidizing protein SoxZ